MLSVLFILLSLLSLSHASEQLDSKIKAAFDAQSVAKMQVLNTLPDGQPLSLPDAHRLVAIVKIRLILSQIPRRLYHAPAKELHWLIDDAILHSQALESSLSKVQKDFMAMKIRLLRTRMWTEMMLHLLPSAYANVAYYRILCLKPLLEVKMALGNLVGWESTASCPDDEHDLDLATLATTMLLHISANLPGTSVAQISEFQEFMIPNTMNDLLHHRPTMAPEIIGKLIVDLAHHGLIRPNVSRLHPDLAKFLQERQSDATVGLLSDRPKQKKKSKQQTKKVTHNNSSSIVSLPPKGASHAVVDVEGKPDEADSEDETATSFDLTAEPPIQIDPSWQPSPIWKLYAKVFKAQYCRLYLLIPLRRRIQSADPHFQFTSWDDLPKARRFEQQLGDLNRVEVLNCIQIVTERNILVHSGVLIKYLHDPQEIVLLTGLPSQMIAELLQYNPVKTEAMPHSQVDFASRYLSERNARRSIIILALHFLIQEMVPAELCSQYNQIRLLRREVAHPPIHEQNLNILKMQ